MENTKQHFSIRKFNVGVVSVLLGLSFIGLSNSQKVDAAVNGVNNDSQSQKSNEQQSASQNKNVLLNSNENKKVDSNNQQEVRNNNSNSTSDSLKQSSNTNNTSESSKQLNNEKKSVANTNVDHLKKNGVLYGNAEAENQIIIYTEPSKDLTPVNQEKGQYKFSDGMKVVGRVFSGYYQKDDSVWADHNANTFEKSRDELVYKDHTGNGKLTLDIAKIAPDYSNYEFDLDFSKQLDATRTDEFQKGKNNGQVEFDYHKVLDDAKNTPFLKNTTYQLFIKPKTQSRLQIKRVHDHSNETLLNWFSNGEGTQHDTYLGTSVVDDYSMGVGTYVNKGLRKAHPDIPIDVQATKYALNLNQQNNANWKFEVNGADDRTFGPNGFMPVNSSHTEANFDFEKLPSKSLTINRGYLDPGKGSTENNAIPEASPISGYTNPNEIPIFIELGNGNKITKIVSLSGKPGETIEVKNKITLPEGAIFDPTSPQLPSTYTFSKNGHNYNDKTAIFATTIRTDNVAYLTKNPALISQSNLTKNDALSLLQNQSIDWIPGAKENIDKYLQSNPIEKTVKESIYINGKLYKVESLNLNRTITFDKSKGKTVIYNNPDNPDIVRSFGAWENDKWQKVEDFASENIELPKDASNVKTDKGIIKDGKLTDVSLFNDAGDPCDVVVNISYDVTPSKGDDTKPTTPSKGDDTKVDSSNAKVFFVVSHKAIVYDKNGRPIKKNGKIITLTKNTFVASLKKAKIVTIKGKKFYQVGKNEFIKVNNVKKVTEKNASKKLVRVSHNAFVYTKNGKAIKNKLHYKLIKRGHSVKLAKNKVVIIKGKKFYQIGKNEFIKVANTKLSTKAIKLRASLKNHRVAQTYDRSGNLNNHYIKGNHVYNFNEKATINGKTYYKLAWTNNWVPASKLTLK